MVAAEVGELLLDAYAILLGASIDSRVQGRSRQITRGRLVCVDARFRQDGRHC
ncbi:hypothetical protein [Bradyrhizobium acaciae]|uniref:hypothetical protein n=1 Tax=Bradyrhizobium acaciae TaxID=2683706 RepID=UPI001E558EFB|nr:hypothetical protein [Bradyrhizobium acaciae]MCC8978513.1 hypothetical protein [Bradyrhizobium acaciae]